MKNLSLALLLFFPAVAAPPTGLRWIAHRGGVVDARYSENSPASLVAAIQDGYWMIESDIRETKDGKVITHHDADFKRFYGDHRKVSDATLAEIRALRSDPGGTPPMTFTELVDACRGHLRLMLDIKEPAHSVAFYRTVEAELKRTGLLETTYIIGTDEARQYFRGKAPVGVTFLQLQDAVAKGEHMSGTYFLFEWGKTLTPEQVRFAQQHGVVVVPSVNTFHYSGTGQDPIKQGSADIQRLRPLGVKEFQIDSIYATAFR